MGLTIHYCIEANQDWTRRQIRQKLEDTRRFALSLPIVSVSESGSSAARTATSIDQRQRETPESQRPRPIPLGENPSRAHVESPWRPGESRQQAPSQMLCLSIYPAEGSEEMNVGWCSFPRFVWKPEQEHAPGWSNVFRGTSYPRRGESLAGLFEKVPPGEDA